jgi:hypothetical protein
VDNLGKKYKRCSTGIWVLIKSLRFSGLVDDILNGKKAI